MNTNRSHLSAGTESNRPLAPGDMFKWRFDPSSEWIEATTASLQLIPDSPGRWYWVWEAWTGSHDTKDLFLYSFTLDYVDESIIDGTFDLGDQGLKFSHCFLTDGGFECREAHSATLSIRLDPRSGISTGKFEANFSVEPKFPTGEFKLTRCAS